jgi:hypothetical protein
VLREDSLQRLHRLPVAGHVQIERPLAPPIDEHYLERRVMRTHREIVALPLDRLLRVVLGKGKEVVAVAAPIGLDSAMPASPLAHAVVASNGGFQ